QPLVDPQPLFSSIGSFEDAVPSSRRIQNVLFLGMSQDRIHNLIRSVGLDRRPMIATVPRNKNAATQGSSKHPVRPGPGQGKRPADLASHREIRALPVSPAIAA